MMYVFIVWYIDDVPKQRGSEEAEIDKGYSGIERLILFSFLRFGFTELIESFVN